jgi:arylsulfatase A-like enzyme
MRYVTTIYVFLTIAYLTPVHAADLSANKPNVIFILAEDSGFADLGCYGHPYSRTPNIDKLAEDGTRFTQFYATGVTCCPTRTGLMTSLVGHDAANNKWNQPCHNCYYQCDWPDV